MKTPSILLSLAILFFTSNTSLASTRAGDGNWVAEDTNVELALNRALNSIPSGWKADPTRYPTLLTCADPSANLDQKSQRCVDEDGRYQLVRVVIPVRKLEVLSFRSSTH